MAYLPLRNYKYDSGPHRIQSGPDHEGYIVVSSGVRSIGADNGIIVDGPPLSGVEGSGQKWGYDANWRYVPLVPPSAGELLSPTAYQTSGSLDSYSYSNISTPVSIAGAKVVSSIESDVTYKNRTSKKFVYYGGACPDNQNYSPFNTPEANTAAEGKTGGGVTHQIYESPLLTNVLGSQGTSDRSQWQYSQPVYCNVYTEAVRPNTPGLMSSIVRSTYRGSSTSYMANYANLLLGESGSFEELDYADDYGFEESSTEPEEIDVGPAPNLWYAFTLETPPVYPEFGFNYIDGTRIALDAYCESYHCFTWQKGATLGLQVVKRQINGVIVWQKDYGYGVIGPLDAPVVGFDDANQILYIVVRGSGSSLYFLSLDTDGNVRYSKVIYLISAGYFVNSITVNPVTHYVTLAGASVNSGVNYNGLIITYDKNGNLIPNFTKISNVTIINGGVDNQNDVRGICYDESGNTYLALNYRNQDDPWNLNYSRRSALLFKLDTSGNCSFGRRLGNFLRSLDPGVDPVVPVTAQCLYISPNNKLCCLIEDVSILSLDKDTLVPEENHLFRTLGGQPPWTTWRITSRADGLKYLHARGFFNDGSLHGLTDGTEVSRVRIGADLQFAMKDGAISADFDYAVASFSAVQVGRTLYFCAGYNPSGIGTTTVSSGSYSYSIAYANPPAVPTGLPLIGVPTYSGTPFSMVNVALSQSDFVCPVSDTTTPAWILLATSGVYDP